MRADIKPHLLTMEQLKKLYSISRTTAYELLNAGKIESVKLGRRRLVKTASIERLIRTLPTSMPTKAVGPLDAKPTRPARNRRRITK